MGIVTYNLDAPGTLFGFGEGGVGCINYAAAVPPAKMMFTIRGLTVEATTGSDVHVLVGADLPSNIVGQELLVDEVIFAMDASVPSPLGVVLRVEDTRGSDSIRTPPCRED